jgi:hypothetical protein
VLFRIQTFAVDEQIQQLRKQRLESSMHGNALAKAMDTDLYASTPQNRFDGYVQSISATGEEESEGSLFSYLLHY